MKWPAAGGDTFQTVQTHTVTEICFLKPKLRKTLMMQLESLSCLSLHWLNKVTLCKYGGLNGPSESTMSFLETRPLIQKVIYQKINE